MTTDNPVKCCDPEDLGLNLSVTHLILPDYPNTDHLIQLVTIKSCYCKTICDSIDSTVAIQTYKTSSLDVCVKKKPSANTLLNLGENYILENTYISSAIYFNRFWDIKLSNQAELLHYFLVSSFKTACRSPRQEFSSCLFISVCLSLF